MSGTNKTKHTGRNLAIAAILTITILISAGTLWLMHGLDLGPFPHLNEQAFLHSHQTNQGTVTQYGKLMDVDYSDLHKAAEHTHDPTVNVTTSRLKDVNHTGLISGQWYYNFDPDTTSADNSDKSDTREPISGNCVLVDIRNNHDIDNDDTNRLMEICDHGGLVNDITDARNIRRDLGWTRAQAVDHTRGLLAHALDQLYDNWPTRNHGTSASPASIKPSTASFPYRRTDTVRQR